MDHSWIVELGIFLAVQTGALIFFAGTVSQTLRDYGRRITDIEKVAEAAKADIAFIRGRGRIS